MNETAGYTSMELDNEEQDHPGGPSTICVSATDQFNYQVPINSEELASLVLILNKFDIGEIFKISRPFPQFNDNIGLIRNQTESRIGCSLGLPGGPGHRIRRCLGSGPGSRSLACKSSGQPSVLCGMPVSRLIYQTKRASRPPPSAA
jgi:hypothetical protein